MNDTTHPGPRIPWPLIGLLGIILTIAAGLYYGPTLMQQLVPADDSEEVENSSPIVGETIEEMGRLADRVEEDASIATARDLDGLPYETEYQSAQQGLVDLENEANSLRGLNTYDWEDLQIEITLERGRAAVRNMQNTIND